MIHEAETLLLHASTFRAPGRYQLEAAIQSAHVVRRLKGSTDWGTIVSLYDGLARLTGSPVVALNRTVAIAQIRGPQAGLAALDELQDPRLAEYQPYWAARADMLAKIGDRKGALAAYRRAIGLEADPSVRCFLQERSASLGSGST